MREHTKEYQQLLSTIKDRGLHAAVYYAKEGELVDYIIELKTRLFNVGYNLTSYQNADRGRDYMDRKWAIYKSTEDRPRLTEGCLFISNTFPNIIDRSTRNCSAYKELNKFEKLLKRKSIL